MDKPTWAEMSTHERDAVCAKGMGIEVIWRWGYGQTREGTFESYLLKTKATTEAEDATVVRWEPCQRVRETGPSDFGLGDRYDFEMIAPYTTDRDTAALLEDEIERRGLREQYIARLLIILDNMPSPYLGEWAIQETYELTHNMLWHITTAAPEPRAHAFCLAVGAVEQ